MSGSAAIRRSIVSMIFPCTVQLRNRTRALLLVLAAVVLHGCATTEMPFSLSKIPVLGSDEPTTVTTDDSATPATGDSVFREFALEDSLEPVPITIQKNDELKVSVWGYPELDHVGVVQANGMMTLPLVGEVVVEGQTIDEVRQRVTGQLKPFTSVNEHALRVGDALTMSVWQHEELYHTAAVAPDGSVTFPLVGKLPAAGRDVEDIRIDAQQRIEEYILGAQVSILPELRNRRMLHDPRVSVLTQRLQPRRVAVIGAVGLQGVQEINGSLTLVEALARASVDRRIAALNSVIVIRGSIGESPTYRRILMSDYFAGTAQDQNIYLRSGDIVIVPKTLISRAGDFVDLFFQRTAPMFAWWTALHSATVAEDSADTVELINRSLREQLLDLNVNP